MDDTGDPDDSADLNPVFLVQFLVGLLAIMLLEFQGQFVDVRLNLLLLFGGGGKHLLVKVYS